MIYFQPIQKFARLREYDFNLKHSILYHKQEDPPLFISISIASTTILQSLISPDYCKLRTSLDIC